tara:strand:+ start:1249 stop:2103 length:855 start_codon:yes stop_codon:yes gene_type:complete
MDFHILDIGAAGGINNRWKKISENLKFTLVEPNQTLAKSLQAKNHTVIDSCMYSEKKENLFLYETKDPQCSSILLPNKEYLEKYYNNKRFEVVNKLRVKASTVDDEFKNKKKPDFIKVDTEGSELEVLKGSKNSLKNIIGLEVESTLLSFRINQPVFSQIQNFLLQHDFEFIDFITIVKWETNKQRSFGVPHIVDCLFLKNPKKILELYNKNSETKEIILKYLFIAAVYNRADLIYFILKNLDINFIKKYQLDQLLKLIEKKISILNFFERVLLFLKNIFNKQI